MSELTRETIQELSRLCRIACTPEEEEALLKDLQKVVHHVDSLNSLDTEGVEPCYEVERGMVNTMRDDEVTETMPTALFLKNAPDQVAGMIRVPTVIKSASQ